MALIRRDPLTMTTMPTLQNEINQLFDGMLPATEKEGTDFFNWQPSVDTIEKDKTEESRAKRIEVN
jgi:hypothetical protein